MPEQKPWYCSKTVLTSGVAFGVAVATAAGVVDNDTGLKLEGLLLPLILTFLRLANKEVT